MKKRQKVPRSPAPKKRRKTGASPRRGNGTFGADNDANLSGRPKTHAEVKEAFRAHTHQAREVLVEIMLDGRKKAADRVKAAAEILNRGWDKPRQTTELTGAGGGPLDVRTRTDMTTAEQHAKLQEIAAQARALVEASGQEARPATGGDAPAASE